MKIALSDNGHSKEWKPMEALAVSFAKMEDGPFGKDYHVLIFDLNSEIAKLLIKFDKTSELEFYFFKRILYISIESEKNMFYITTFGENLKDISEQILKDKKVVIGIFKENELEKIFYYDIIL